MGNKFVDAAFDRFYGEVKKASDGSNQALRAITRLVRALHVMHTYADGNGRTNIHTILPMLLLQYGFTPVVPDNMSELFSGSYTVDFMVEDVLEAIKKADARQKT